jgi:cellulose synthase/poly-beta-1,6-N-acetylglucosamine synthase-like glycosyltransferase
MNATVLVAGQAQDSGQKVHNLLYATENAGQTADVLIFCDADARFARNWISNLIAPLENPNVGVATGYRWYVSIRGGLPGMLRSSWNASVVTMLGSHSRNFAWGGSMALRRETFDRLRIRAAWRGSVSDDYAVTRAAREARVPIVFVPVCLVPSYGRCTWSELLEFTTRQIIITRVYDPTLWRIALLGQTIFNVAFWWSLGWVWSLTAGCLQVCVYWR